MLKVRSSVRARLCAVAVLMAVVSGCGGGGGGGAGPAPSPSGPPAGPPPAPEVRGWSKPFGSASVVLGHSDFDGEEPEDGPATPIYFPLGAPALTADGRLYASSGERVLIFNDYDAGNGPVADFDINVDRARHMAIQGERLVTFGASFQQVRIYDNLPTASDPVPRATAGEGLGCDALLLEEFSAPFLTPSGRLIVADARNNRVLIWNDALRDGPLGEPNVVLGQGALDRCTANDDDADGDTDPATRRTLSYPAGVWANDNLLIVADTDNNRVLIWDNLDTITSFAEADHVIGQQNFNDIAPNGGADAPSATTLFGPKSVDVSAAGELAVTDTKNHRVLIWRTVPFTIGTPADHVVGQSDFESGAEHPASAKTLRFPEGARFQGRDLVVNDHGNHRVMVWRESD